MRRGFSAPRLDGDLRSCVRTIHGVRLRGKYTAMKRVTRTLGIGGPSTSLTVGRLGRHNLIRCARCSPVILAERNHCCTSQIVSYRAVIGRFLVAILGVRRGHTSRITYYVRRVVALRRVSHFRLLASHYEREKRWGAPS